MTDETKKTFTRRLMQCNRGEMIVVMYDIFFAHLEDGKAALEKRDDNEFSTGIRGAIQTVDRLMKDLDFKYDISYQLYSLYIYVRDELSKSMYEMRIDRINSAENVMRGLYKSFVKVAELDHSEPLMQNTQRVYAGMTYGRGDINENLINSDSQRGFLA